MKKLIRYASLLLMITSFQACQKKTVIQISGRVRNIDGATVRITNAGTRKTSYDSAIVKNGKFVFNTVLPEEGFYNIDFENNHPSAGFPGFQSVCLVYLENDTKYTFISAGRYDTLSNQYQISPHSQVQQDIRQFQNAKNNKIKLLNNKKSFFLHQADIDLENRKDQSYRSDLDSISFIDGEMKNIDGITMNEFIIQHPVSILTPYLMCQTGDFFEKYLLYRKIIDALPRNVKKTKYAKKADARLRSAEKLHAGGKIPEIYGNNIHDQPFTYDFSDRKYILINFWASWSMPSRMQTRELKQLYSKYHKKGFDIISISLDERRDWWLRISERNSIPWTNICETAPVKESKNVENFKAKLLPYNYLINGRKEIITREIELSDLEKFLKASL